MSDHPLALSYQFQHTPLAGYTPVKADVNIKTEAPQAKAPAPAAAPTPAPKSAVAPAAGDAVVIAKRKPSALLEGAKRFAANISEFAAAGAPALAVLATGVGVCFPVERFEFPWIAFGTIAGAGGAILTAYWQQEVARKSFDTPNSLSAGVKAMGAALGCVAVPAALAGFVGAAALGDGWGLLAGTVVAGATWLFGDSVLQVKREQKQQR